jgi:hypothetical protein
MDGSQLQIIAIVMGSASAFASLLLAAAVFYLREFRANFDKRSWMIDNDEYSRSYYTWFGIESVIYLVIFSIPFFMAIGLINEGASLILSSPTTSEATTELSSILQDFQRFLGLASVIVAGWIVFGLTFNLHSDFFSRLGRAVDEFTTIHLPLILSQEAHNFLAKRGQPALTNLDVGNWSQKEYAKGKGEFYEYARPEVDRLYLAVKKKYKVTLDHWATITIILLFIMLLLGIGIATLFP